MNISKTAIKEKINRLVIGIFRVSPDLVLTANTAPESRQKCPGRKPPSHGRCQTSSTNQIFIGAQMGGRRNHRRLDIPPKWTARKLWSINVRPRPCQLTLGLLTNIPRSWNQDICHGHHRIAAKNSGEKTPSNSLKRIISFLGFWHNYCRLPVIR